MKKNFLSLTFLLSISLVQAEIQGANYSAVTDSNGLNLVNACSRAENGAYAQANLKCINLGYKADAKKLSSSTIKSGNLDAKNPKHQDLINEGFKKFCTVKVSVKCQDEEVEEKVNRLCYIDFYKKSFLGISAKRYSVKYRLNGISVTYRSDFKTYSEAWTYANNQKEIIGCRLVSPKDGE